MKIILLSIFVAAAFAAPIDDDGGPIDVIVNGVPDGEPLEIGHLVDIKVQEHENGELAAVSNVLQPYTAQGLAEAAAAAAAIAEPNPSIELARSIDVSPVAVVEESEVLVPVQVVEAPEVVEIIPEPAAQIPNGQVLNDGSVEVIVNTPQDSGVLATLQSWFNMVINYFSNGAAITQQIV